MTKKYKVFKTEFANHAHCLNSEQLALKLSDYVHWFSHIFKKRKSTHFTKQEVYLTFFDMTTFPRFGNSSLLRYA
ncbi:IS3 family transposase [Paenibacillus sp. FSL H8-0034]|uniref:IS3 family transposase n=1 Tax=Paenibacillus sp. FSL H8-0034 TaxID=2954671 RepID=UPI004046B6B3